MKFDYCRRLGSEIEVNALDGKSHPLIDGDQPEGIQIVANIVAQTLGCRCEIYNWYVGQKATDFNDVWIVKPDGSCGIEVCSPVGKGLYGIGQGTAVVTGLRDSGLIKADRRCSLHIHVEVGDLAVEQIASILAHWVKCEYTMLLAMPDRRKKNRYCQAIGMSDLLRADLVIPPDIFVNRLGAYKYYTANAFHYIRSKRPTIEFRIADEEACLNPKYFKNWNKLVMHFVETAINAKYPEQYDIKDPQSGYLWLYPEDVLKFLGFDGKTELCRELQETRDWFIDRISINSKSLLGGIWDDKVVNRVWTPKGDRENAIGVQATAA